MKTLHDKITDLRLLFTEVVDELEQKIIEVETKPTDKRPDYLIRELNSNYDAGKMLCKCNADELFSQINILLVTYPNIIIITL